MVELNDRVNGLQIIPYNMVDAALYFIVFVNLDKTRREPSNVARLEYNR